MLDPGVTEQNYWQQHMTKSNYVMKKSYAEKLVRRIDALEQIQPEKTFHLTFVTVYPMERTAHSDIVTSAVTADELFR